MAQASPGPLPLHPMTLGDILDGAFRMFTANWRTILIVAGSLIVPVQVLSAFLQRDVLSLDLLQMMRDPTAADVQAIVGGDAVTDLALAGVAGLAAVFVLPFVAGAVAKVVGGSFLGERPEAGPVLRAVGRRWWSLVVSFVLVHLLYGLPFLLALGVLVAGAVAESGGVIAVGVVLLLAGGLGALALMALFMAVAPAVVVESLGPLAAMGRSFRLVRPRLFPVLGVALVSGLLASILANVLSAPFTWPGFAVGSEAAWVLVALGSVVGGLVTTPLVAIVATLVYFDARIRHEALDLEVMAAELQAR
ncbi:MAG: hypothetical protein KY434_03570 [Actinobacteria bacterium]|nr:hypothetical protein [Actinomycetota bacterium]